MPPCCARAPRPSPDTNNNAAATRQASPQQVTAKQRRSQPTRTQLATSKQRRSQPARNEPARTLQASAKQRKSQPARTLQASNKQRKFQPARFQPTKYKPARTQPVRSQQVARVERQQSAPANVRAAPVKVSRQSHDSRSDNQAANHRKSGSGRRNNRR